ncbi:cytochrome P450 2C8-like [Crotalus adamanteus]|uniref:Cytochrome P450 2C8-like n=1 Tax=Crotalus adamanteus TaxID=8729 RepID=A0AAW1BHE0_CROAD
MSKIYGNIFTLWFGPYPVIILQGFQAVKDGLTTHPEDVAGRPLLPLFKAVANNKDLEAPTRFSMATLKVLGMGKSSLQYQIQEEAEKLVEEFRKSEGKPMNPYLALNLAVSNVICALVFGRHFSTEDETFHRLLEAIEKIFSVAGCVMYNTTPGPAPRLPVRAVRSVFRCFRCNQLGHRAAECPELLPKGRPELSDKSVPRKPLEKSRAVQQKTKGPKIQGEGTEPEEGKPSTSIQLVICDEETAEDPMTKNQPKSPYDEKNLVQNIFDLFVGGTETPSTTLYWALLYMVLYPDIQAKVQKEIDTLLPPGQSICYEDRKNLPYTNAVAHEIQRFSNIVSIGVPRYCIRDTMIQKFHLRKGTIFIPNMASALHDANEWETPLAFNPNHFLDKEGNFICREAFVPFSLGHRACLGENLAKTELFLFFTNLVQTFNFHLADGSKDIKLDVIWGGTLHPHSFEICAIPR